MSNLLRPLSVLLTALLVAGAVPATATAGGSGTAAQQAGATEARLGGFRARPSYRTRPTYRRPTYRRNRPSIARGFVRGVLTALGISFLLHALFGWGAGGSPLGLLLLGAIVLWIVTRSRRRRLAYRY